MLSRRSLLALTSAVAALAAKSAVAQILTQTNARSRIMNIKRSGSEPSAKGPADYFTGSVRVGTPVLPHEPGRPSGAYVTFEPGARTAWHTHPLGQTLIITAGFGWVQRESGPVEEIRPGDVVWFPPGERHWHGATATTAMTHIAIQESIDGTAVEWMEHVSDEQYGIGASSRSSRR